MAVYDPDMSSDYLVWDHVETVVYYAKTAEALPASGFSVSHTLWEMIDKRYLESDSIFMNFDVTVEIPSATMNGVVPKQYDQMKRADGTKWIIMHVEIPAGVDYRVRCVKNLKV